MTVGVYCPLVTAKKGLLATLRSGCIEEKSMHEYKRLEKREVC